MPIFPPLRSLLDFLSQIGGMQTLPNHDDYSRLPQMNQRISIGIKRI
jgi:hypothetical protein